MKVTLRRTLWVCLAAVLMIAGGQLMTAQDQPAGGDPQRPTPEQMRERRMQRIKTEAGVPDADWTALQPKIQAVMEKQLPPLTMMMGGFRGRGGMAGQGGQGMQGGRGGMGMMMGMMGPRMEELTALREALAKEGATDADIKPKLDAFVEAYKKRQAELKAAQDDLAKAADDKAKLKAVLMMNGLIPVE